MLSCKDTWHGSVIIRHSFRHLILSTYSFTVCLIWHFTSQICSWALLVCTAHVICGSMFACACTEQTRICTILSSIFKLGLYCVNSKCLTICRRSLHPRRDLDSMAVANTAHSVCTGTQSEICHGLCLYLGTASCLTLLMSVGLSWEWACSFCGGFFIL